jgi:hypothetical protein
MKYGRFLAALAGATALAGAASAADYVTIVQEIDVAKPADAVWAKVGGYCDIAGWLKVKCAYTSGTGGVGTVRRIADRIDEVMVSSTPLSYTYAQPGAPNMYHGTLEVRPAGKASKIVYTVFYDQEPLATPEARTADHDRRAKTFKTALENMKAISEAP